MKCTLVGRPPTRNEVTLAEAIALALTRLLAEKRALQQAWAGGEPVSRTFAVTTHAGKLEVTLATEGPPEDDTFVASGDLLADLAALVSEFNDEEIDFAAREQLEGQLLEQFWASPEAKGLTNRHASSLVMSLGASYLGQTIATLDPAGLREILFDLIPRRAAFKPTDARAIIEELRALYAFMKREHGFAKADACLRVLGSAAIKRLEAGLADRRNFGMAKSLAMAGADHGFDVNSEEGIMAWMASLEGKPLPPSLDLPFPPSAERAPRARQSAKIKAKAVAARKAARKARKKTM